MMIISLSIRFKLLRHIMHTNDIGKNDRKN